MGTYAPAIQIPVGCKVRISHDIIVKIDKIEVDKPRKGKVFWTVSGDDRITEVVVGKKIQMMVVK